jgi:UDPglucose 6-dehydrogenase
VKICIIGTGYVGLVTAACFAETGNHVYCFDIDKNVVDTLKNGKIHIYEPGLEQLVSHNISEGRLTFSSDLSEGITDSLFLFNCVGTPSTKDGACDLTYVYNAAKQIGKLIDDYKIIVNKSTVPIGTASEVNSIITRELEKRDIDIEFDVVSNPEFLKEGDAVNDFMKPDRIIIGLENIRTAKLMESLYAPFARNRDKIIFMNVKSAEMTKYAANCMLATKISFMNEMANICEKVGADIGEVRRGIGADHRIGHHFIYPGVGYGGSCFPKDVRALINTSAEAGYEARIISAVDKVNNTQKKRIAEKVLAYFPSKERDKPIKIALWGLSFKAKTDDIRESASLTIIEILTNAGFFIQAFDPVAGKKAQEALSMNKRVRIIQEQYVALKDAEALIIATDWNQFKNPDFNRIKNDLKSPVIFDGRNLYSHVFMDSQGIEYYSIGR